MGVEILNRFLGELGSELEIDNMKADENGYFCLTVDDLTLHLKCEKDHFLSFLVELDKVSSENETHVMRHLLDANVLWRDTGGATLGMDGISKSVVLCYKEPILPMDYHRFQQLLDAFLKAADAWIAELAELSQGKPGTVKENIPLGMQEGFLKA